MASSQQVGNSLEAHDTYLLSSREAESKREAKKLQINPQMPLNCKSSGKMFSSASEFHVLNSIYKGKFTFHLPWLTNLYVYVKSSPWSKIVTDTRKKDAVFKTIQRYFHSWLRLLEKHSSIMPSNLGVLTTYYF